MFPLLAIAFTMPMPRPSPARMAADGRKVLAWLLGQQMHLRGLASHIAATLQATLRKIMHIARNDGATSRFVSAKARHLLAALAGVVAQAARCRALLRYAVARALSMALTSSPVAAEQQEQGPARKTLAVKLFNTRCER